MQGTEGHLSSLRRYARALVGSVSTAEAVVCATLDRLVQEPTLRPVNRADRARLFQLFTETFASRHDQSGASQSPEAPGVSKARQALLLTALEGFGAVEAGSILGVGEGRVSELVEEGRRTCEPPSLPTLIIHDETFAAMDLEMMLEDLGHRVVGIARTREEAAALAATGKPQLILGRTILNRTKTGLAAIGDVLLASPAAVVIVTIFPQGLLTGRRSEPVFVLGAPFCPESLATITSQAIFYHRLTQSAGLPLDDASLWAQVEAALVWLVPRGTLYSFTRRPVMPSVIEANAAAGTATVDLGECRFIEGSAGPAS